MHGCTRWVACVARVCSCVVKLEAAGCSPDMQLVTMVAECMGRIWNLLEADGAVLLTDAACIAVVLNCLYDNQQPAAASRLLSQLP